MRGAASGMKEAFGRGRMAQSLYTRDHARWHAAGIVVLKAEVSG